MNGSYGNAHPPPFYDPPPIAKLRCRHSGLELYVMSYDKAGGWIFVSRLGCTAGAPMLMASLKMLGYQPVKDEAHDALV